MHESGYGAYRELSEAVDMIASQTQCDGSQRREGRKPKSEGISYSCCAVYHENILRIPEMPVLEQDREYRRRIQRACR